MAEIESYQKKLDVFEKQNRALQVEIESIYAEHEVSLLALKK